jgi:hypothetical protein
LSTAPFSFRDADTWILGMLGLGLSVAAVVDAAGLDDPYPGFGAVARRREEAITSYAAEKSRCFEGLQRLRDAAIADMNQVIEMVRVAEFDLRLAVEGRIRLHANYLRHLDHLDAAYRRLVLGYREANLRSRTVGAPSYFAEEPGVLALERPPLAQPPELGYGERFVAIERMEHYVRVVNSAFQDALPQYHPIPTLTDSERRRDAAA